MRETRKGFRRVEDGNQFEKLALSVLAIVIVGVLGWVGVTVNQNQLQYARIEERLANQSSMLLILQGSMSNASQWHSRIERDMALMQQRIDLVEKGHK